MKRRFTLTQTILIITIPLTAIVGAAIAYEKITNPHGVWCLRYDAEGNEKYLRGKDCGYIP